jgi:phytoene dehydrogenase-like protein
LLLGDPVEHILVHDGRACGVRLKSSRTMSCQKVIAGIHPKLVLPMLPGDAIPAEYRQGLMNLEETPGVVCVRLLVNQKQHEALGYNLFRIHKVDGVNIDGTFFQLRQTELAGWNVLTMIRGSDYSDWKKWQHTQTGSRGPDYEEAKLRAAESMIKTARSVLGTLEDYKLLDISTPLTMRDWVASPEGSMYGLLHSVKNDLQYAVLTRLPVRSLYLVGQSAIAPGLLGVTLSVLRGVGEVAGRANFQNFLAGRLEGQA